MAERPLEVPIDEICADCKKQRKGQVDRGKVAGTADPPTAVVKEKREATDSSDDDEETAYFEASGHGENAVAERGSKQGEVAHAKGKMKQSKTSTVRDKGKKTRDVKGTNTAASTNIASETTTITNGVPEKRTLAEQGWVKLPKEPDWNTIPHSEANDPGIDEDPAQKPRNINGGSVKIIKSEVGEAQTQNDEHPEWELVETEAAEDHQGVTGCEMREDDKRKCTVN